jgi:outer membrane receptor protein involved in Fe transport
MTWDKARKLGTGASLFSLAAAAMMAAPVHAQDASAPPAAEPTGTDQATNSNTPAKEGDIVVTGSRIPSGFRAPTPVTVVSAEQLRAAAPGNLADGLNELPIMSTSFKTNRPIATNVFAVTGQNLLDLRGLGANRTLVLIDGRRLPSTNGSGSTDVNILPQNLVQRVDIVTGGASAAYGSDAVAGVVNFALDTKFKGFKGEIKSGLSTYGDLPEASASIAFGSSFAGDRGRIIASAEYFHQDGLRADQKTGRKWFDVQNGQLPNPVAGARPSFININDIRSSLGTFGGLISSGPLKGTQFLAGGIPATFNYGTITGSSFQSGGDGAKANTALEPTQERYSAFVHTEFDVSDKLTVFAEGSYARSHTIQGAFYNQNVGAAAQYTIFRDNAYLPASILQRMIAAGVQSIPLGRFEGELPLVENESKVDVYRGVFGLKGKLGGNWAYDASYSYGRSDQELRNNNLTINRRLYASADAVVDPASGKIVCRSTLLGLDPGCVPRDLFGPGQPNQAVTDYVTGDNIQWLRLTQQVANANIRGDLGDSIKLAGPISIATGLEYRRETASQTVDPLSPTLNDLTGVRGAPATLQGKQGPYRFFNPLPFSGAYDIKEGYIEIAVPILRDSAIARSLDFNGAIRHAIYSNSGGATTWKLGAVWQVVDAFRLRGTYSQDIRGPNILELYNPTTQVNNNLTYKGVTTPALTLTVGNPNLRPERARTLTFGAVAQPAFASGLQLSLDYYRIIVRDAIATVLPQTLLDQCAAGNQNLCSLVTVTPSNTLIIRNQGINLASRRIAGLDFEGSYRTKFADGSLTLRLIANHQLINDSTVPGSPVTPILGDTTAPKWNGLFQVTYAAERWSLFAQERVIGSALLDAKRVEGIDVDLNHTPAIAYTDLTLTYDIKLGGQSQQIFLSVSNLLNQAPPRSPPPFTTFTLPSSQTYDQIGRFFTAGVRFKF